MTTPVIADADKRASTASRRATAKRTGAAKRSASSKRAQRTAKRSKSGVTSAGDSAARASKLDPKRAPMAARVARPAKTTALGVTPAETPAYIRSVDSILKETDKAYLRRKLGRKLGKFAASIERTSVRVEDVNGPRGGTDKRCAIKVVLRGLPTVYVEERHASLQAAMDLALARTQRAVRQSLQRRRTKPKRARKPEGRASAFA